MMAVSTSGGSGGGVPTGWLASVGIDLMCWRGRSDIGGYGESRVNRSCIFRIGMSGCDLPRVS